MVLGLPCYARRNSRAIVVTATVLWQKRTARTVARQNLGHRTGLPRRNAAALGQPHTTPQHKQQAPWPPSSEEEETPSPNWSWSSPWGRSTPFEPHPDIESRWADLMAHMWLSEEERLSYIRELRERKAARKLEHKAKQGDSAASAQVEAKRSEKKLRSRPRRLKSKQV